jgi:hypothetical protein
LEEVKRMKERIIVFALVSLMMFAVVAPVLAQPAERVSFIAKQMPNNPQPQQGDDYVKFTTPGDTVHIRNQLGAGTIKLWFGSTASGTPAYVGTTSSIIEMLVNLKTGEGPIKYEMTWTFTGGTFEGNINGKIIAPTPTANIMTDLHGVLQGTGVFEGQTIQLEGSRPTGQPFTWTGTILTR